MRKLLFALLFLCSITLAGASSWRTFSNRAGESFEGKVVDVDDVLEEATFVVRKTGKNAKINFNVLSESDIEYLHDWVPGQQDSSPGKASKTSDGLVGGEETSREASTGLYPYTKSEVRAKISEILKRKPPEGIERSQQEVINQLNVYRFLSGVLPNAVAEKKKIEEASLAAAACEQHGVISHDLGDFTDKCNLYFGSNMLATVAGYIGDSGDNNREKRGHRRWCLNPRMVKTGFGAAGKYSAMWSMDNSGPKSKEGWSYPGRGYFPLDYLHDNAWSFYSVSPVPPAGKLKIEVWRLHKRPESKFSMTAEIPGRVVPVNYVYAYANVINFEPEQELISKGGVFWVRITGGGLREGYLVEFF